MIYTLTFSPSIDYWIEGQNFELKNVNRFENSELLPGGKGINASIVLTRHGHNNLALSFFDNQSISLLKPIFEQEKLQLNNIESKTKTRINIKFFAENTNFELNGPRTKITSSNLEDLKNKLNQLQDNDVLMIMGSTDITIVKNILNFIQNKKIHFIYDIDNNEVSELLKYKPFLIKPNKDELERNFNLKINNEHDVIKALWHLQKLGAQNVIISMDKNGSYLLTDKLEIYKSTIINPIKIVSSTGAGDTLISIFAAKYLISQNALSSFHFANAAAMGTVSQKWLTNEQITESFINNILIKKIN